MCVCVCVSCQAVSNSLQLMDCSLPGSFVHRILQARILDWVAIPFSRGSSWPREWTQVSGIAGRSFSFLPSEPPGKPSHDVSCHSSDNRPRRDGNMLTAEPKMNCASNDQSTDGRFQDDCQSRLGCPAGSPLPPPIKALAHWLSLGREESPFR